MSQEPIVPYARLNETERERKVRLAAVHGLPSASPPKLWHNHLLWCSADVRKPIGGEGCGCLRSIAMSIGVKP